MKKHSIFLFLALVANNVLSIANPFSSQQTDSCPIPQMVEINELNMVGLHPMELEDILKSLKNRVDIGLNRMLMYGPPGTGKSKYAEEIARIADCNFIQISGPSLKDESNPIQKIINIFAQAQNGGPLVPNFDSSKPTVISIEDVDAISNKFTESTKDAAAMLWLELDRIKNNDKIFVFLSTNHKELIHLQILDRMGPNKIETKLPDKTTRQKLFKFYLADFPELEEHFDKFVKATNKASHKDIANACSNAIETMHYQETVLTPELVLIELAKEINTQSAWAYISELAKNNPILAAALATGMIATVAILSYKRSR